MVSASRPSEPEPEAVAAWLSASCARAGVAVQVTDPNVLRQIGVLLGTEPGGAPRQAQRAARPRGRASQSPDCLDPVRVEVSETGDGGWSDDDVVDEGPDNRGLSGQVEIGPSGA